MRNCEFCNRRFIPNKFDDGRMRFCCKLHQYKGWRKRNPDRARAIAKKTKDKNREKIRNASQKYYELNKGKMQKRLKEWRRKHKAQAVQQVLTRMYRVRGLMGNYTLKEWEETKRKQIYRCAICKKRKKLHRDHIIPVTKPGSTNFITNIQALCQQCNSRKSNHVDAIKV